MATTSLARSSLKTLTKYDSFLVGNAAYDPDALSATWLISRVTADGSSGTVTFNSIPQTYKHLQIRLLNRTDTSDAYASLYMTFNGDTSASYRPHNLTGNGTSAYAGTQGSAVSEISLSDFSANTAHTSGIYAAGLVDIHDYSSTTKNKTIRAVGGRNGNSSSTIYRISLVSGALFKTNAITSISLTGSTGAGNFISGSTFALYGMVG